MGSELREMGKEVKLIQAWTLGCRCVVLLVPERLALRHRIDVLLARRLLHLVRRHPRCLVRAERRRETAANRRHHSLQLLVEHWPILLLTPVTAWGLLVTGNQIILFTFWIINNVQIITILNQTNTSSSNRWTNLTVACSDKQQLAAPWLHASIQWWTLKGHLSLLLYTPAAYGINRQWAGTGGGGLADLMSSYPNSYTTAFASLAKSFPLIKPEGPYRYLALIKPKGP